MKNNRKLPYLDPNLPVHERVELLLERMTVLDKVHQLHGTGQMWTRRNRRLKIPDFRVTDGPRGISDAVWRYLFRHTDRATWFPAPVGLASAWDPELAKKMGTAIAVEAKAKGRNWLLAPALNIVRDPRAGRTQECYGEDPYLAARLGVAFTRGIQEVGIIATPKHFACHNQELDAGNRYISANVDERTLHEIYFPAFKACVQEGGALSVMSARHSVNGTRSSENSYLLKEILRDLWGFDGVVISDWKCVRNGPNSVAAQLDLSMPKEVHYGRPLLKDLDAGRITEGQIDTLVRDVLRVKFKAGLFEKKIHKNRRLVGSETHRQLALEVARDSIVLLKNDPQILPLAAEPGSSLAVLGPTAKRAIRGDTGSSEVRSTYRIPPLAGLRRRAGSRVKVRFAPGCGIESRDPEKLAKAVELARSSDTAIVFVGLDATQEREDRDRKGNRLRLPEAQNELIEAVVGANPNTVVVLIAGGAISMPSWGDRVPAILSAWFPGEQGGRAIAEVLFGDFNPSGKLPLTFPRATEHLPAYPEFPQIPEAIYDEGIFVGYRYFDREGHTPLYPFGHGLSYTQYSYDRLQIEVAGSGREVRVSVSFELTNKGERSGAEIVQLYLGDREARVPRPEKELKRFEKVHLGAGETRRVELALDYDALTFFDPDDRCWRAEAGIFDVLIGASSSDIRLQGSFDFSE